MAKITAIYQGSRALKPADEMGGRWGLHQFWDPNHKMITCPGVLDGTALVDGLELELHGEFSTHPKFGHQFAFKNYSRKRPKGREGIIAFLKQAPGVGSKIAGDIFNKFGEDSIDMLINKPDDVAIAISGLRTEVAKEASETLMSAYNESKNKIPLLSLFAGIPFPKSLPDRVLASGWPDPLETVKRNPFVLCELSGVGFRMADRLRLKLRLPPDMPERHSAAAIEAFEEKSDTVWVHTDKIANEVANFLEVPQPHGKKILRKLYKEGMIEHQGAYLALKKHAENEKEICRRLCYLAQEEVEWPDVSGITQDEYDETGKTITTHQATECKKAVGSTGRIGVLLGKPGTGKTHTIKRVIDKALSMGWGVQAAAPTSKAAQKMNDLFREEGIPVEATTIHSLLGAYKTSRGWVFRACQEDHLTAHLVVIDETSMNDNLLMVSLFRALGPHTRILFVGDTNQLPPVGRGSFLRDYRKWCDDNEGWEYGELVEIKRNSGEIVKACHEIASGIVPKIQSVEHPGLTDTPNLQLCVALDEETMARKINEFVGRVKQGKVANIVDPIKDLQFLVSINKDSPVSREELNKYLQSQFNPRGQGKHPIYKVGDKIVCLENCKLTPRDGEVLDEDGKPKKFKVSNGELGVVVESLDKRIVVTMDGNPGVKLVVPTGTGRGGFDLGYAITSHKSQGSEWKVVITVMGKGFRSNRVICREWVYTAISRAKQLQIVIGTSNMIRDACKRVRIWDRHSFFKLWMEKAINEITNSTLDDNQGSAGKESLDVRRNHGTKREEELPLGSKN